MSTTLLPFFPLNTFLLPGEELSLHIFEPRYRELIADSRRLDLTFGMPYVKNNKLSDLGTEVKIKSIVKEYENGTLDIVVQGINVFELVNYRSTLDGKLYAGGFVKFKFMSDKLAESALLHTFKEVQVSVFGQNESYDYAPNFTINQLAVQAQLTYDQKYQFVSITNPAQRERYLLNQLRLLLALKQQEEQLEYNFFLN